MTGALTPVNLLKAVFTQNVQALANASGIPAAEVNSLLREICVTEHGDALRIIHEDTGIKCDFEPDSLNTAETSHRIQQCAVAFYGAYIVNGRGYREF